jgi:hypothetical protein
VAQKHVDPVDPDPQHWYVGTVPSENLFKYYGLQYVGTVPAENMFQVLWPTVCTVGTVPAENMFEVQCPTVCRYLLKICFTISDLGGRYPNSTGVPYPGNIFIYQLL